MKVEELSHYSSNLSGFNQSHSGIKGIKSVLSGSGYQSLRA